MYGSQHNRFTCSTLYENHTIFILCKIKAKELPNYTVH
ncbi:MAG: hypothetical protein OJF51_002729 [Nitrospira sp.]|nr:MAG: hypothetical protein OJF51_002729 [Nitrospira sp.]